MELVMIFVNTCRRRPRSACSKIGSDAPKISSEHARFSARMRSMFAAGGAWLSTLASRDSFSYTADGAKVGHSSSSSAFVGSVMSEAAFLRRKSDDAHIRYLPIKESDGSAPPMRRVVLAWRRSFTRYEAIAALRNAIYACELPGVKRLS